VRHLVVDSDREDRANVVIACKHTRDVDTQHASSLTTRTRARAAHTPVTHTYAALAFYTGGRSRMEINGEWTLREGDALLVPAGAPHRMLERKNAEYWGLAFCVPCFGASSEETSGLLQPFERVRDGASAVVRIPQARQEYLATLFRELQNTPVTSPESIQRSLLTLILAEVDKSSSSGRPTAIGTTSSVVTDALRFIERNCLGRRLTLKDIAEAVHRSPAYVTTALSRATGRSANEWIVSGRMAEARRLLLHSDEMVDVIAERVGYADATHFIRMFRREHGGATPTVWRAAQRR